jgi:hypothetical protein
MDFHYWTQPLPAWASWYASKLPMSFQKLSVVGVLAIELVVPWFLFSSRRLRYAAFGAITLLMVLIAATGNYNFFNLLTVVLALTLLDDDVWPGSLRRRVPEIRPAAGTLLTWRTVPVAAFGGLAVLIGASQLKEAVAPAAQPPASLTSRLGISQFYLVNEYGLFRQMTESRPEIVIEGSSTGEEWHAYHFRWKPGDPSLRPLLCAPHQPRLDWQMWFEALRLEHIHQVTGTIEPRLMSAWFREFLGRLSAGEPAVTGLLRENPFAAAPPKFIRIILYQYRFTTASEARETGNWWHRDVVWVGPGWVTVHGL